MMTIEEFCDRHEAYDEDKEWMLANCKSMVEAWDKAEPDLLVWIATRHGVLSTRVLRKFAAWCANQLYGTFSDDRSRYAVIIANLHADGKATDEELEKASQDAWCTARQVAWAATWDDARQAAESASEFAATEGGHQPMRAAQAVWLRANATPCFESQE